MIKIILERKTSDAEIARTSRPGNEQYLLSDKIDPQSQLGQLSMCSYDVFTSDDMPTIINELNFIKSHVAGEDDAVHVDEIITLAKQCRTDVDLALTFTPFD